MHMFKYGQFSRQLLRYTALLAIGLTTAGILAPNTATALSPEARSHLLNSMLSPGRISTLIETTGNRLAVELTASKIETVATDREGPGVWAYEWRQLGMHFETLGDEEVQKGNRDAALQKYNVASALYQTAYFPENFYPEQKRAYIKFRDIKYKMRGLLDFSFEVVKIPYDGATIVVHLYRPKDTKNAPLVLYTGGLGGSKENADYASQGLAERGIALASFDLAGTGESSFWPALPDSHNIHSRVLDYFEKTQEFDFSRIGVIGGGFGGYYAIQVAVDDSRVKAAVNHCGSVDSAFNFSPEQALYALQSRPSANMRTGFRAFGLDPDSITLEELTDFTTEHPFSLSVRGYVGTGGKTIHVPLLTVSGGRDPMLSIDDMRLLEEAADYSETWILGRAGHCAPGYMTAAEPHMLDWLDEQLNE